MWKEVRLLHPPGEDPQQQDLGRGHKAARQVHARAQRVGDEGALPMANGTPTAPQPQIQRLRIDLP